MCPFAAGSPGDPPAFAHLHAGLTQFTRKLPLVRVLGGQILGIYLPQALPGGGCLQAAYDAVAFVLTRSHHWKRILPHHNLQARMHD